MWGDVVARVTADAVNGEILEELARDIMREDLVTLKQSWYLKSRR